MAGDNREVGAETVNAEAQAGIEREVGVWRWESGEWNRTDAESGVEAEACHGVQVGAKAETE